MRGLGSKLSQLPTSCCPRLTRPYGSSCRAAAGAPKSGALLARHQIKTGGVRDIYGTVPRICRFNVMPVIPASAKSGTKPRLPSSIVSCQLTLESEHRSSTPNAGECDRRMLVITRPDKVCDNLGRNSTAKQDELSLGVRPWHGIRTVHILRI
jgi:hypothetical protein